jgi:hypothetical protein
MLKADRRAVGNWGSRRELTSVWPSATMLDMQPKDFGKYLRGKSVAKLLHRARKESLKRITANAEDLEMSARAPALKRTGTR